MSDLHKFKLRTKLLCGFLIVAMLSGVIGAIGVINVTVMSNDYQDLDEVVVMPMGTITGITDSFHRLRVILRDALLADSEELMKEELQKVFARKNEIAEYNLQIMEESWKTEAGRAEFQTYMNNLLKLYPLIDDLTAAIVRGDTELAIEMLKDGSDLGKAFNAVQDNIYVLSSMKMDYADTFIKDKRDRAGKVVFGMMALSVAVVILAVAIGFLISHIVSKPIKGLVLAANRLAVGDVDTELDKNNNTYEVDELITAFQNIVDNVKGQSEAALKIAAGDLSLDIVPRSDKDVLAECMASVVETLRNLRAELDKMSDATAKGDLHIRGDEQKFDGEYKSIIQGFNRTAEVMAAKVYLFEEIIDAVPFPVSVTDMNRNWLFINKAVEDVIGYERADAIGKPCSNREANICNTESCGIECLERGIHETSFSEEGKHYRVNTEYIHNASGEKIGYIELMQDDTLIVEADKYQKEESERLVEKLNLLAQGQLNLDYSFGEGNEYTETEYQTFKALYESLEQATEGITAMVKDISNVLSEIAGGNLDLEITAEYRGDFLEIKDSMNHIIRSLSEILGDINEAAEQVSSGSRQVSDGSQALSQGSTEQASSIEELTASISEIAAQTKQNAGNANKASELANTAKDNAIRGDEHMKEMLTSMEAINESSMNISKIIKVIDDIAFQTNILALNAAVEAARAGQHGKGFAVVAEEVRSLAARSASAASETTELIEGSIHKVQAGTKIANETAAALKSIVTEVEKAADLIGDIANASNEQASGIAQINMGIEQVSQVVQNNSATAEESAAASEELSSQAELLKERVNKFRLYQQNVDNEPKLLECNGDENETDEIAGETETPMIEPPAMPKILLDDNEFDKY